MQPVPRIFVSATSRDLRTARGLVSEGLRRMECLPIVQDDFPPDYKTVREMLRTKISTCNAVVHLAGFYYGAEPQPVIPGPDRRSFTQMEYEIAMELKLPCYVFLCGKDFPFDSHDPEPPDKQQLQLDHRNRLLQRDELFYEFASPEELANRTRELQLSVEGLRKELAKERNRRRMTLAVAVAAVLIACVGGWFLFGKQKKQEVVIAATNAKLDAQGALIAQLLAEQERLRKAAVGSKEEIVQLAEQNVAKATNRSVEDVRRGVAQAVADAEEAVAAAKPDASKLAEALKQLADAQLAAGHENEAIDALKQRFDLLDREKSPVVWAEAANELANALNGRDVMSKEPMRILRDGVEWAQRPSTLGPEHPATLALMTSLARIIVEPIAEAIGLNRFVLMARERKLGRDHPDTLEAVLALARKLSFSNSEFKNAADGDESEKLFRRVVDSRAKKLGADHADTLDSKSNLAYSLSKRGKFAEAEALYREVLQAREKKLGPDHADTILALQMISIAREDQKDYPGSIELIRRALAATERTVGPDDGKTLLNVTILAGLLSRSKQPGSLDEAETLYRRALDTRLRTIGAGQPDTLQSFDSLAMLLEKKGDKAGAKKLKLRRLEEQGKAVGSDDTGYALELFIAASELFIEDDNETAKPLAERCLAIRKAKLGPEGKETQDTASLLAKINKALATPVPSFEDFATFRKEVKAKSENNAWKEVQKNLPSEEPNARRYVLGWVDGKTLHLLMSVDANGDDGTFTFYYWREGRVASVFKVREGTATRIEGVAKATDTYNFVGDKLVGWRRTQDDKEADEDPGDAKSVEAGQRILAEAKEMAHPIRDTIE